MIKEKSLHIKNETFEEEEELFLIQGTEQVRDMIAHVLALSPRPSSLVDFPAFVHFRESHPWLKKTVNINMIHWKNTMITFGDL